MKFSLPFVSLLLFSHFAYAEGSLSDLASGLQSTECYTARATYEVLLPNSELPVGYNVDLMSYTAPDDSLAPCRYLIKWEPAEEGKSSVARGFSAYFDGNFFRFQGGKLVEYHTADNPSPFMPGGSAALGVQNKEQFASLLPQMLGRELGRMASDSTYTYTFTPRGGGYELSGSQTLRGYVCSEFVYRFDSDGRPTFKEVTNNPDQIGEQVITINYKPAGEDARCFEITEQGLINQFPNIFDKYRRDSFALQSLRGEPLPSFSAPTLSRDRYNYTRGESLGTPTVIAVLNNAVDGTADVVSNLREAVNALPFSATLIFAFIDKDSEAVAQTIGQQQPGEVVLVSARSLARDCGITDSPSILFCKPDGNVADIHVGRNNKLKNIVIQKVTLTR